MDAEQWTLSAAGSGLWGTSDGAHGRWVTLTGDGSVTARVSSVSGGAPWASAGVSLRTDTTSDSAGLSCVLTRVHGVAVVGRALDAAPTALRSGGMSGASRWLRLQRVGNQLTAFERTDAGAWREIDARTITLGASCHVGLIITGQGGGEASATISDVTITGAVGGAG